MKHQFRVRSSALQYPGSWDWNENTSIWRVWLYLDGSGDGCRL